MNIVSIYAQNNLFTLRCTEEEAISTIIRCVVIIIIIIYLLETTVLVGKNFLNYLHSTKIWIFRPVLLYLNYYYYFNFQSFFYNI